MSTSLIVRGDPDPYRADRYTIPGYGPVPSVTQLLRAARLSPDYTGIPVGMLDNAARRGTTVHAAVERLVKTPCVEADYESMTEGKRIQSVMLAIEEMKSNGWGVVRAELALTSKAPFPFGGTADLWLHRKRTSEYAVADIKNTVDFAESYFVQCCGYEILCITNLEPHGTIDLPLIIQSNPTGKMAKIHRPKNADMHKKYRAAFASAIRLWYDKAAAGLPQGG